MKPPVVVVLSNAYANGKLSFRNLDLELEVELGKCLVERLRGLGYDNFIFLLLRYPAFWQNETDEKEKIERFESLVNENGGIGVIAERKDSDSSYSEMVRRAFLEIGSKLNCGMDEPVLKVLTECIFMTESSLMDLVEPLGPDIMLTYWNSKNLLERPNGMTKRTFIQFAESGRMPSGKNMKTIGHDINPLPQVRYFAPTAEFKDVFKSLLTIPLKDWSYSTLAELYKKSPELFHKALRHVGVELTNDDNLPDRLRSPRRLSKRSVTYFERKDWECLLPSLVRELEIAPVAIDFWDYGEPLMHPEVITFIEEAVSKGIRTDIYTNGILLDSKMADRIIGSGLDSIFFRLDAASPETYGIVSGNAGLYQKALDNLKAFLDAKRRRGLKSVDETFLMPLVAVQITEMAETEKDVDKFFDEYDYVERAKDKLLKEKGVMPTQSEIYQELYKSFPPVEYVMLRHDHIYCGKVERKGGMDVTPLYRFACRQLREGLHILSDGRIVPCREDIDGEIIFGNVKDGIDKIWRSEEVSEFRKKHFDSRWEDMKLCSSCRDWYCTFV